MDDLVLPEVGSDPHDLRRDRIHEHDVGDRGDRTVYGRTVYGSEVASVLIIVRPFCHSFFTPVRNIMPQNNIAIL